MLTFTEEFMKANCGCYSEKKLMNCSFMQHDTITLQSILDSEIPFCNKVWFSIKKVLTQHENIQLSINCAEAVMPLFESKYPKDGRIRKAIEGAKNMLNGKERKSIINNTLNVINHLCVYRSSALYAAYAAYDIIRCPCNDFSDFFSISAVNSSWTSAYLSENPAFYFQKLNDCLLNACKPYLS